MREQIITCAQIKVFNGAVRLNSMKLAKNNACSEVDEKENTRFKKVYEWTSSSKLSLFLFFFFFIHVFFYEIQKRHT